MRGLRVRQKEITKISKADAHQRLREILEIAMPTSFVLKKDVDGGLAHTLAVIACLAMRELSRGVAEELTAKLSEDALEMPEEGTGDINGGSVDDTISAAHAFA
jgi:hypothetical protein